MKDEESQQNCPLCGQSNRCAGNTSCWCFDETFPSGLLALVPDKLQGKACICRACVVRFKETDKAAGSG